MSQTFTTPKGTPLPLLMIPKKIKRPDGSTYIELKPYLQVQHRLIWFREEAPDWTLRTEIRDQTADSATIQAFIETPEGRIRSTGMKREDAAGWSDFLEKAETGAIGRALAHAGFGTQFAIEMEDGAAEGFPVDSPAPPKPVEGQAWGPPPPNQAFQPPPGASPPAVEPRRKNSLTVKQESYLCVLVKQKLEPSATNDVALLAALNAWAGTQYQAWQDINFQQATTHIEALKAHGTKPDADLPF